MHRLARIALVIAAVSAAAACGGTSAEPAVPTVTSSSRPVSPAPVRTTAAPTVPLAADFAAFFAGCEDGVVPPAGIFVTCDPADGSDTAEAAAAATCARMKADLGPLAPTAVGTPLGVQNGGFDPMPSAIRAEGAGSRLLRCTFGAAARVDVAAAPVDIELAGTVAPPPGAKECFGHLTPTVDVACRTSSGSAFEVVLAAPSARVTTVLHAFEADPA